MPSRHILHVFATFGEGGAQVRSVDIFNGLAAEFRHTIVAMDRNFAATRRIAPGVDFRTLQPPPKGGPAVDPFRLGAMIRSVAPDLLVTYNWGAMDAVAGARLLTHCPVLHTEDGFGRDEAVRLKQRRVLARRILLRGIHKTIVPSWTLLDIARRLYCLPENKVKYLQNGIDTDKFQPVPRNGELRRQFGIADDEVVFGSIGHLRPEKNLEMMIQAFHQARLEKACLVLVGDGVQRASWESLAKELKARVIFVGHSTQAAAFLAAFDVFAMSSVTEQAPISLLEAMSCGLPVISTDCGDIRRILPDGQSHLVTPLHDVSAYCDSMRTLTADADLRSRLGAANRDWCLAHYRLDSMIAAYAAEYREAIISKRG